MIATLNITVKVKHAKDGKHTVILRFSPGQEPNLLKLSAFESHLINFHIIPTEMVRKKHTQFMRTNSVSYVFY